MPHYHVYIVHYDPSRKEQNSAYEVDLSEKELMEQIVTPYLAGQTFMCGGHPIDASLVKLIRVSESDESSVELVPKLRAEWAREYDASGIVVPVSDGLLLVEKSRNVTRKFIPHPPRKEEISKTKEKAKQPLSRNIFIVHGRDDKPKLELARMLEKLGFNAIILSEQPDKGRTIIEKLEQETLDIGFAFVILTPDDMGELVENAKQGKLKYRARQNVILELGYFVGKIGRNRVCCLYNANVEVPSDIHGVIFKKFRESVEECYKAILEELKAVGYEIKL